MNSFRIFRIAGIDISINWTWLLAIAFITWSLGDFYHMHFSRWGWTTAYVVGLISGVLLFVTVLLHELGHSFTARARGLPVNSITLFIFGGVSNLTQEPQTPQTELLVAIAGPLVSLVLSGIFYLLALGASAGHWPSEVTAVLEYLAFINLTLAIFNLIPGFPLDGGRVFRAIVWLITHNLRRATHIASDVGQGIGYLFILGGLLEAFVLGAVVSGIYLAFVGWFLQNAASASYKQTVLDQVLSGVDVRDVMDKPPVAIPSWTTVDALVYHHMLSENQRAVPVTGRDGSFEGLVTLADVRSLPQDRWATTQVGQIMTPDDRLTTVAPDTDLRAAMQLLATNNFHQLPVMQDHTLVGILNRAHVLQWLHLRQQLGQPPGSEPPATPHQEQSVG